MLARLGIPGTGSLRARSFEDYGVDVPLADVRPGDIVVFWRKSRNSGYGHVGIVVNVRGENIDVLGGNQGDEVTVKDYSFERFLCFRRATGIAGHTDTGRPTIRRGDRGAFVVDLQDQLVTLFF